MSPATSGGIPSARSFAHVRKNFLSPVAKPSIGSSVPPQCRPGPLLGKLLAPCSGGSLDPFPRSRAGLETGHYKTLEVDNAGLKPGHYKSSEEGYRFAPKASRRPSQSFTTNSRQCQGMLPSPRVNSRPWADGWSTFNLTTELHILSE